MAKKRPPQIQTPAPRDMAAELRAINEASVTSANAQAEAQIAANRSMMQEALAATDTIAGKLNNSYTANASGQLTNAGNAFANMGQYGQRLGALGGIAEGDVQGTQIEAELRRQALSELQLGRSLSPEEERMAQQSGRAGYAARGMAVGQGSALAEVLNRDSLATARQSQRQAFAGTVNQAETQNRLARLGAAGNLLGQAANVYQGQGQGQMGVAQGWIGIDPYQRALGSSLPGQAMGTSAAMVGNAFGQSMQYGQDLINTNFNAAWSDYLNNQNLALAGNGPKPPSGMFARMMAGASAGGQVGGFYGALGGAFDGATNGPIYKEYAKQTGAPK